jgi:endonuclease III
MAVVDRAIVQWFEQNRRDLPWRRSDPWGVYVSEIMLQQTSVARVLPAWHAWVERWPTPGALADDSVGEAIRMWGRLGYPRRAKRMHEAAVVMRDEFAGRVPDTEADLRRLPGVGEYTAAAVAAFAYGRDTTVVDINVRRFLVRLLTGRDPAPSYSAAERALIEWLLMSLALNGRRRVWSSGHWSARPGRRPATDVRWRRGVTGCQQVNGQPVRRVMRGPTGRRVAQSWKCCGKVLWLSSNGTMLISCTVRWKGCSLTD